jgi:hypothetical protein
MKKEDTGRDIPLLKNGLREWMMKVESDDVDEMLHFKSLVERNIIPIMGYFRLGATNAIADYYSKEWGLLESGLIGPITVVMQQLHIPLEKSDR